MVEIMCESGCGNLYHAGVLEIEVPQFKTYEQARKWCMKLDWKSKGKDGAYYRLYIHEIMR
jgi:hypothetical protein